MSKLDSDTENKNCENYSLVSVKCVNNTVGGSNIIKGKSFSRKIKRKTATRKERRKKSSKKKVSFQNTKGEKYIKNLSNRTLTDTQISLISRGLKFIPVNKSQTKYDDSCYEISKIALNICSTEKIGTFTLSM